ncbi:phosphatase PAP2 family protein [Mucilaginibacter sp. RS28]|uniref:Phosphatase PAP2 family protein n=1 Tax=Mucilaginibacter straminoryzae TaxID=2932774 RepID=A0A9X1X6X9_9SPHI|nr:phosphatase PAP2 family protein [Mucilaginibacter straminoryzae]MCJ8211505.1 phosphatase PAP2 family protein [Mucilaginibacter straminoryzae]
MGIASSAELFPPVNTKTVFSLILASVLYLALSYFLVGFKSDQVVLICLVNGLYYLSGYSRRFVTGFAIFIVYWIIFDYMKAFPNYHFHPVHIGDLYQTEKKLFGIHTGGDVLTPNEYLKEISKPWADVITGFFYLCWIPVPLGFAAYLLFTRPRQFLGFALTFFLVNFLGFIIYYTYPAAPPWFIQEHGFNFIPLTKGSTAGLDRFDQYFHAGIFKGIYEKGSNVFAAMPSLHSSYPVIVLYYGLKNKLGWINLVFATVMIGIWFTAVYASHHYVMDVMAGITCAIIGISLFNWCANHIGSIRRFLDSYEKLITS